MHEWDPSAWLVIWAMGGEAAGGERDHGRLACQPPPTSEPRGRGRRRLAGWPALPSGLNGRGRRWAGGHRRLAGGRGEEPWEVGQPRGEATGERKQGMGHPG